MNLFCGLIFVLCCFVTLSLTQNLKYSDQRRSGYNYIQQSANPSNSYFNQGKLYPYKSSTGLYKPSYTGPNWKTINKNYGTSPSKGSYQNGQLTSNQFYDSYKNKQLSSTSNFKRDSYNKLSSSNRNGKKSISKADAENGKFAGAENQENDEDGRTLLHLKHKKFHRHFAGALLNPCSPYGRDASKSITPPPKEQGRFLWDVNVYNYYPQSQFGLGCAAYGGLGGGSFGAGLLSDPVGPAYYPPGTGIANFLSLFAPGILQNSLAATSRPQQFADYSQSDNDNNNLQSDPAVDPNYMPGHVGIPFRKPNQIFYDSAGAPPLTPGQLTAGISSTVNGIIQQLTGNVQPVYG